MPALNNAEKSLIGPSPCRLTTSGPLVRSMERSLDSLARRRERHTFVECHHDVGSKRLLNFNGSLRRNMMQRPIKMGLEGRPFIRDFAQLRQTKDLKPSAIRQNGAGPC